MTIRPAPSSLAWAVTSAILPRAGALLRDGTALQEMDQMHQSKQQQSTFIPRTFGPREQVEFKTEQQTESEIQQHTEIENEQKRDPSQQNARSFLEDQERANTFLKNFNREKNTKVDGNSHMERDRNSDMERDKNIGMEHGESTDMESQKKGDQHRLQKTRDRRDSDESNRQKIDCCPADNKPGQKDINCCAQDDEPVLKDAQRGNDEADIDEVDTDKADMNKQSRAVGTHSHHHHQQGQQHPQGPDDGEAKAMHTLGFKVPNVDGVYRIWALDVVMGFVILVFILGFDFIGFKIWGICILSWFSWVSAGVTISQYDDFSWSFIKNEDKKIVGNSDIKKYALIVGRYIRDYRVNRRIVDFLWWIFLFLIVQTVIGILAYFALWNDVREVKGPSNESWYENHPSIYVLLIFVLLIFIVAKTILQIYWYWSLYSQMREPPEQDAIDEFKHMTTQKWDIKDYRGLFPSKEPHKFEFCPYIRLPGAEKESEKLEKEYKNYTENKFHENGEEVDTYKGYLTYSMSYDDFKLQLKDVPTFEKKLKETLERSASSKSMLQMSATLQPPAMEYMLQPIPLSCTIQPDPSVAESMSQPNPLYTLQPKPPTVASAVDSTLQSTRPSSMLQPTPPATVSVTQIVPSTTASVMQITPSLEPLRPDPTMSEPISPAVASAVDSTLQSTLPSSILQFKPPAAASMTQIAPSATASVMQVIPSLPPLRPSPAMSEPISPTVASTVDSILQSTLPSSMSQPTPSATVSTAQIVPSTTASVMHRPPSLEPPPLQPNPTMSESISPTVASTVGSMLQPIPPLAASMLQSPTHTTGCVMDSIMDSIAQSASPIAASMQPIPAATAATQPAPVTEV